MSDDFYFIDEEPEAGSSEEEPAEEPAEELAEEPAEELDSDLEEEEDLEDEDLEDEEEFEDVEPVDFSERLGTIARKVAEYSLVVLVGLLPILVNPFAPDAFTLPKAVLVGVVTTLVVAAWLLEGLSRGRLEWARTPIDIPLAVYLVLLCLATLFSKNVGLSVFGPYKWKEGLVFLLSYGVLFWAAATYVRGRVLRPLLAAGGLTAILVSVYAIAQRLGFDVTSWLGSFDPTRSFSTLGNPVYLGAYAVLVAPVALGVAMASKAGSQRRLFAAAVALFAGVAAATSFSRGAWLGLAVALVIIVLAAPDRRRTARWVAAILLVVIIAAAVPVAGQAQDLGERLQSMTRLGGPNEPRVALWRGAATLIARNPVLGVGPEAFRQEFAPIKPQDWAVIDPEDKSARAHSDLLHVAATAGIPAALAYLAALLILLGRGVWVLMSARGRTAAFQEPDGAQARRTMVTGMVAGMAGYVVFLQVNFTMVEVTPLFWVLAGATVAMTKGLGTGGRTRSLELPDVLQAPAFSKAATAVVIVIAVLAVSVFGRIALADYYFGQALTAESGGRMGEGVTNLERAISLAPREDYYHFFLGKAYVIAAQTQNDPRLLSLGVDAYEKALTLNRADTTLLNALGSAFYTGYVGFGREDDASRADFYYKRTLALEPNNTAALHRLGQLAFNQGKYALAVSYFEQATELEPDNSSYHYNLAVAYENDGQYEKAEEAYQRSLELEPDNEQAKNALDALKARPNGGTDDDASPGRTESDE